LQITRVRYAPTVCGKRRIARLPVAVVERGGRIVAFANMWPGPGWQELSVDPMRFHHDAPNGVMEGLLVHVMRWGKEQGYRSRVIWRTRAACDSRARSPTSPH